MFSIPKNLALVMLLLAVVSALLSANGSVICREATGAVSIEATHTPGACSRLASEALGHAVVPDARCSDMPYLALGLRLPDRMDSPAPPTELAPLLLLDPVGVSTASYPRTRSCFDSLTGSPPKPPITSTVILLL